MNSFIFNFKEYFIIFLTILILGLVLIFVATEIMLSNKFSKNDYYENIRNNLWNGKKKYAVFGDSRSVDGVIENPIFSNFALQGNNLETIINMAEFHLKKNRLNGIIFQLDPHYFSAYRLFNNQDKFLQDLTRKRISSLMLMRPQYRQYILEYWKSNIKLLFKNSEKKNLIKTKKNDIDMLQIRVDTQLPIKNFFKIEYFNRLKKFIALTKSEGIKLCLISFPVSPSYIEKAINNNTYKKSFSIFKKISNDEKIIYKNYYNLYDNDNFKDPDHMNLKGAKLFSQTVFQDCFGVQF